MNNDKLTIWQEIVGDDPKTNFCVYKNEKIIKTNLSSMEVEDLQKLCRMVDGLSHKLWHIYHFKVLKCCPTCKVKKRSSQRIGQGGAEINKVDKIGQKTRHSRK